MYNATLLHNACTYVNVYATKRLNFQEAGQCTQALKTEQNFILFRLGLEKVALQENEIRLHLPTAKMTLTK